MGIRRSVSKNRKNFTTISNFTINDTRLSFEARGLLISLLSKPDEWIIRMAHLENQSPNAGKDKLKRMMDELEELGYLTSAQLRNQGGTFMEWERVVYEVPIFGYNYEDLTEEGLTADGFTASGLTADGLTSAGSEGAILSNNKYKEINIQNTEETNSSASAQNADGKKKPYFEEFEVLWAIYPRKLGKIATYKKVATLFKDGVTFVNLLKATENYAKLRSGEEAQFTMHPQTFYGSSRRYEDFLDSGAGMEENDKPLTQGEKALQEYMRRRQVSQ